MDAGALFGRMVGQVVPNISPGIFSMVGSAAYLAGIKRMTASLAAIVFELTGEAEFILPFMIAILTAKWVADSISVDGVYDLAQHIQTHHFLDSESAIKKVRILRDQEGTATLRLLIPPMRTMQDITVRIGRDYQVSTSTLQDRLSKLKARGVADGGLVFLNAHGVCYGYVSQPELEHALQIMGEMDGWGEVHETSLLDGTLSASIGKTPLLVSANAPLEHAVELFGKLGESCVIVIEEHTAKVVIRSGFWAFWGA